MRRRRSMVSVMGAFASAMLAAGAAVAQDASDPVQQRLDQMQAELDRMRQENAAMKGEIDDLRAKTDADWLTEARAEEIRALVAETLADADTRASLLDNGLMAGWSEHFFLASADGRFKLVLEGQEQIRFIYNYRERDPNPFASDRDQHRMGFENTRTKLTFHGHVFSPDIQYLVRGDFGEIRNAINQASTPTAGTFRLQDAWVRYNFDDKWSLRFGQFKLPFNREELVSSAAQLAVERSLVNESTNVGRSQGVELAYAAGTSRFNLAISDGGSGVFGFLGTRTNTVALTMDTEYAVTGRYERLLAGSWDQFDDFTSPRGEEFGMLLGLAGHFEETESTGVSAFGGQSQSRFAFVTADLSLEWGGANAFIAGTYQYMDLFQLTPQVFGVVHVIGIVAQAGVYIAPKWEVFIRGEYAQLDGQSGSTFEVPDLNLVTAGFNYYIDGHDVKWTTDIGFGISNLTNAWAHEQAGYRVDNALADPRPQVVFRTQFQLLF